MSINTIVGQAATGDNFFKRSKLTNEIWRIIQSGSDMLFVAPRRVGKTSVLYYLRDNPLEKFKPLYIITESINDENEFFKRLYSHVFELLDGVEKFSRRIKNLAGKNRISEISKSGVKLEGAVLDYYNALIKLFEVLDLDGDKLVIMIDEYPETVKNIERDKSEEEALRFLQRNRELRHLDIVKEKAQFNVKDTYKEIINTLVYDGYINNNDNPKKYLYNSPILKRWWQKYVAN